MPIVTNPTYSPPFIFKNTHINTIYSARLRHTFPLPYVRKRVTMPDDDFVDLDWSEMGSDKLVFCLHGLEGNSRRPYVAGMMKRFNTEGWDAVGMNLRGCSGEDNRYLKGYHSGCSDDLDWVLNTVLVEKKYRQIVLVGFSVGGNIALKYTGEKGRNLPSEISHVIAYSVPCNLESCSLIMETPKNFVYLLQFLITLKQKAKEKAEKFPNQFDLQRVLKAKNFRDFDSAYTAPINGFVDCFDYWTKASSAPLLKNIAVPTLLINALDDTFLAPQCFPTDVANENPNFHLEMPKRGGHLGFMSPDTEGYLWTEHRAWAFVKQ